MKTLLFCVAAFAAVSVAYGAVKPHPLSDEFIASINSEKTTWKAGRNFHVNTPWSHIKGLLGVRTDRLNITKSKLPLKLHKVAAAIPESFDAREAWPKCADIIGEIRDQASCGSCWAFGAVEAISDRICIHSDAKTKVHISAEDLNDCCFACGSGCYGGYPSEAWAYWQKTGIVTGDLYATTSGCKAYSIKPCDHHVSGSLPACGDIQATPACRKACDSATDFSYKSELYTGSAYRIASDVKQIQTEILTNGPVEADFVVYTDFVSYKSGVYQHTKNSKPEGGHAIKILGWGVEAGTPYWLAANSWNEEWGDKGYFKILRGADESEIEDDIIGGIPNL